MQAMTMTASESFKAQRKATVMVAMDAALTGDTNAMLRCVDQIGRAYFPKPTILKVARELVRQGRPAEALLVLTIRYDRSDALDELAPLPTVKVGDIFVADWGYDQTNLDWYEVIAVKGSTVTAREIMMQAIEASQGSETMIPVRGAFIGAEFKARIGRGYKGKAYINDQRDNHAYAWDGTPRHQTASGYGH